jgi:anti-sigma regulatory factor (Ser/Thr protein kinase)
MEQVKCNITRDGNIIFIAGDIYNKDAHYLLANIYQTIEERGFRQIMLDFEYCTHIFPPLMLNICSYAKKYQLENIDFDLKIPKNIRLSRLFINSNWAHLISPQNYENSRFIGFRQVPATQYKTAKEQTVILNKMIDSLLCSYEDLDRHAFSAVEWAINEIMDNVLTHSESPIGGIAQLTTYNHENKKIEIIVTDAGLTIPKTLFDKNDNRRNTPIKTLEASIKEGVTNGKGQGNGLFGTYNICHESKGVFVIDSGAARLIDDPQKGLFIQPNKIPVIGTTVCATINCNVKNLLEKALKFDNKIYYPIDYIEINYEQNNNNHFIVIDEAESVGNRDAALPLRLKIKKIANWVEDIIYIDFKNLSIPSSSFIDEFIVKLILDESPIEFTKKYKMINISNLIIKLRESSYRQRTGENVKKKLREIVK